jgi:rRNA-processing protein FCF1
MNILEVMLGIAVVVLLIEVTYLIAKMPRQSIGRGRVRSILIDTSVLIDGRIISVAKSGFISDTLVIPRSVVRELQYLADNADHEKRARARYGLDVVRELQSIDEVTVEILADGAKVSEGVDERLLTLAKKYNAAVCTIDYNLNKVAVVEGITVLNVNELAQSLRMAYLPGERMRLELVQKGQDPHQGVGYLPDGTMVVVEFANKYVGQTIEIEFIRSLQTAAGKMMFARRVETQQPIKTVQKPIGKKPVQNQNFPAPTKKVDSQKPVEPKQQSEGRSSGAKAAVKKEVQDEIVPPVTAVYHSDLHEAKKVARKNIASKKPAQNAKAKAAPKQPSNGVDSGEVPSKKASQHRQKSSGSREESLIDLVNKQQD